MIFVRGPVPGIRAALGYQAYLRAAGSDLVGVGIGRYNAKFLHRIECNAQHAVESLPGLLIVYVHAIQRDIGLIRFSAVDRSVSIVRGPTVLRYVANERNARLETEQSGYVSALEWELPDLC